ncbi:hypothetical protein L596_020443 [Steinernema carpocapsae]|uniref:RRM domain-containing protein n=1 Tax=Steinernema carpocapsae TaxID=34508 RepID=A0A4U5MU80_STECR|nr:hypothetical protein L596_020443 [Steinernema carpocapsae]
MDSPSPRAYYKHDENSNSVSAEPSIVIQVRDMNPRATEADLLEALSPFGIVSYATCVPNKRMALVEFEDIQSARCCIDFVREPLNRINVFGRPVKFNFSTSQRIARHGLESEKPNHVLVLSIYNAVYRIDASTICEICESHAKPKRIVIIRRQLLQALVEFADAQNAKMVKNAINGADIYKGCCTIKAEFSHAEAVTINCQDADHVDYTIPGVKQEEDYNGEHYYGS